MYMYKCRFTRRAIVELATDGYYFRDTFDSFHSNLMERLLRMDPEYAPALGTHCNLIKILRTTGS